MNDNTNTQALITVAIPAYNEEKTIANAIDSIRSQDIGIPINIIVVDNASTDKTAEVAKNMGIDVIHESTKGVYYSRQAALKSINTEFVIFIDADTILSKHWIRKTYTYLKSHPNTVVITSNYYFYDADFPLFLLITITQFILAPFTLILLRLFRKPDLFMNTAFIARTEVLKRIGGFSKEFHFYGEDIDLGYRFSKEGKVKFFLSLFFSTSGRRYKKFGILKTLLMYYVPATYILLGKRDKAILFSNKYS